jgi:hypothetical protein
MAGARVGAEYEGQELELTMSMKPEDRSRYGGCSSPPDDLPAESISKRYALIYNPDFLRSLTWEGYRQNWWKTRN